MSIHHVPVHRLDSLTGMRFLAAAAVFGFHLSLHPQLLGDSAVARAYIALLANAGWFGVTFFFVLSGFVLAWSARPADTYREFVGRRLVKIYPNHLVTFVVAFGLFGLAGATTWEAVGNLTLLHAWVPRDTSFFSINHPSWSLSTEMFFYLMFPLLWAGLRRTPSRALWPAALGLMAVIMALPLVAAMLPAGEVFGENHRNSPLYQHPMNQVWLLYAFPPARLLDFALGMLMAMIVRCGQWPGLRPAPLAALVALGYLASLTLPVLYQLNSGLVGPLALLIAAVAADDARQRAGWLRRRWMVFLGEVSFAFYLLHDIVLTWIGRASVGWDLPAGGGFMVGAIAFAASLAGATVLYRTVERPLTQAWARRRSRPAESAREPVSVPTR